MDFDIEIISKILLMVMLLMESSTDAQDKLECTSPKYLEYGQPGIIDCSFERPLFGVYWFNSTEYNSDSQKIIYYSNSQKQGTGFISGEFDLSPTGSLIINNVTFQHDHVFTVIKFNTISDDTIPISVNVVVIVKPLQTFPTINTCGENRFCLRDAGEMKTLSCYVNDSWPAINLNFWTYNQHHQNWTAVSSSKSTAGDLWQTSIIQIGLSMTDMFTVYMCAADEPPVLMDDSESVILIKRSVSPSEVELTPILVERGSDVELPCSTRQNLFVLWMRQSNNMTLDIAHKVIGRGFSDLETEERYLLTNDSNLVISDVSIHDEGIYVCVAGDGVQENVKTFNVTIKVQPNPQWIVVDGCFTRHNCSLPVRRTGLLRCSLLGVRPVVPLKWRFVDGSSPLNKFQKDKLVVTKNADSTTYDVTLSSEYHIEDFSEDAATVECFAFPNNDTLVHWSHLSTQAHLELTSVSTIDCCRKATSEHTTFPICAATSVLVSTVVSISFGLLSLACTRGKGQNKKKKTYKIKTPTIGP